MAERICSESECHRRVHARGLCSAHYQRIWKLGLVASRPTRTQPPKMAGLGEKPCRLKGCKRKRFCRKLCAYHYGVAWRRGDYTSMQLALPFDRHSLTNIDPDAKLADCSICGFGVPIRFRPHRSECNSVARKRSARRGEVTSEARRRRKLREYKLTMADYEAMLARQGGLAQSAGRSRSTDS